MILKLDEEGGFPIESLRPLLGDNTDLVASYSLEETEGGAVILTLFDGDGSKILVGKRQAPNSIS
jgi:hypothetical protein